MKRIIYTIRKMAVLLAAFSLCACSSGKGKEQEVVKESALPVSEAGTLEDTLPTDEKATGKDVLPGDGKTAGKETGDSTDKTESEVLHKAAKKDTDVVADKAELIPQVSEKTGSGDAWSIPEVTVDIVPENLPEALIGGEDALFTYLGSERVNYEYISSDYATNYGFFRNPTRFFNHSAYGAIRFDKNMSSSDNARMLFVIMPDSDEELAQAWEDMDSFLGKMASVSRRRMLAAPDNEQDFHSVYSATEYVIGETAYYLIEGYRMDSALFRFDDYNFSSGYYLDQARNNGSCEKCIAFISKAALGGLSTYSLYDMERYVRFEEAYQELQREMSDDGLYMTLDSSYLYNLDEYSYDTDGGLLGLCYIAFDLLDCNIIAAEDEDTLEDLKLKISEDTRNMIDLAEKYEQLQGYKGTYATILGMAAALIHRGETDAAAKIVSWIENAWKEDDRQQKTFAFGDTENDPIIHVDRNLSDLQDTLANKTECKYLQTLWTVKSSAPYKFGVRDVVYGSSRYEEEYGPLISDLAKLDGYRNAQLYIQELLQPFLEQAIDDRDTKAADEIIGQMEAHFPDCGEYVITTGQMEGYHEKIETIREEEAYKAAKQEELKKASPGDVIGFGYKDGKALEWVLLDKKDGEALLLSNSVLDVCRYDAQQNKSVIYTNSEIRELLEDGLEMNIFTNIEKTMTSGIDLLKTTTVLDYLPDPASRVLYDDSGTPQPWWIKGLGSRNSFVRYVDVDGTIAEDGTPSVKKLAVRPVIWVDYEDKA